MKERIYATWPARPTANGQSIILVSNADKTANGAVSPTPSTTTALGDVDLIDITFHDIDQASAANGLRAYASPDGGTTWYETDLKSDNDAATVGSAQPSQVPALTSVQEWRETFVVSHLKCWAIEFTAGATPPGASHWAGTIALHRGVVSVRR